jgi:hypothetical protein
MTNVATTKPCCRNWKEDRKVYTLYRKKKHLFFSIHCKSLQLSLKEFINVVPNESQHKTRGHKNSPDLPKWKGDDYFNAL